MKLLTDEVGFQAMLDAVQERTKGHTIFLYLPKPIDLEARWKPPEVSSRAGRSNITYEDDEDPSVPADHTAFSHKAQINHLRQESSKEVTGLEHRYPIGNHPLFPNKRIYAKGGMFWELTSLRLDVWAAAIHQSTNDNPRATYDAPPMSNHFTKDKAIKPSRPPPNAPTTVFAAYGAYHKGQDYIPPTEMHERTQGTFADDYRLSQCSSAMSDYDMPHIYARPGSIRDPPLLAHGFPGLPPPAPFYHPAYYPYQFPGPYYPTPNVVQPQPSPAPQAAAPATSTVSDSYPSPGITMKHSVTLEAFCTRYLISAADSEKLSKLEYNPGNRIVETLTVADWQSAGFTVLSWRTFLSHHRKFCDAIIAGTWV
ncbi:hypothetical protein M405DRAFT_844819 [Rhizopogon salebrosus TDB-379]|nr:hypothetical protein M405DRAFT_844819 [Rhizopogon salebrosus TDB-379]